ncbi:GGDEF domain-containing protein [Xanthobacter autotrophicus DSM 431]|uniref:GGDEF domain-containing protein n=1 Tax=Xanthobacter nonsaccharivorans TaxID=3119912 RepID=UPI0037268CFF
MHFHAQTTLAIAAMVGVMLAAVQFLAGWRLRTSPLAYWGLCNICLSAGSLFIAARPTLGLHASVLVGNGLLFVAMGLLFSGIRAFDGRPPLLAEALLTAIGGVLALAISLAFGDNMPDRVTIVSLVLSIWAALSAVALLETPGSGPLLSRFASGVLLLAVALFLAIRGLTAQLGAIGLQPFDSPVELGWLLFAIGLAVAWSFGSLFMVLERLASVDDLTGLLNRRATLQQAASCLKAAKSRRLPLSLLLADLDHFKLVNDRFGHDVGDTVLRRFAAVMPGAVRPSDVVGRHGGEEFCIALPGADEKNAQLIAERLRLLAEANLARVDGLNTAVTLSVGTATFSPGSPELSTIPELIAAADKALYAAKAAGRNRVFAASRVTAHGAGPQPLPQIAAGPAA